MIVRAGDFILNLDHIAEIWLVAPWSGRAGMTCGLICVRTADGSAIEHQVETAEDARTIFQEITHGIERVNAPGQEGARP